MAPGLIAGVVSAMLLTSGVAKLLAADASQNALAEFLGNTRVINRHSKLLLRVVVCWEILLGTALVVALPGAGGPLAAFAAVLTFGAFTLAQVLALRHHRGTCPCFGALSSHREPQSLATTTELRDLFRAAALLAVSVLLAGIALSDRNYDNYWNGVGLGYTCTTLVVLALVFVEIARRLRFGSGDMSSVRPVNVE